MEEKELRDLDMQLYNRPRPVGESKTLAPRILQGFQDLKGRQNKQGELTELVHNFALRLEEEMSDQENHHHQQKLRIRKSTDKQRKLRHRLIKLRAKVEILQCRGLQLYDDEYKFRARIEGIYHKLNQPTEYLARLNELESLQKMQRANNISGGMANNTLTDLDPEDLKQVYEVLQQQKDGLKILTDIVKRDQRHLQIILQHQDQYR